MGQIPQDRENGQNVAFFLFFIIMVILIIITITTCIIIYQICNLTVSSEVSSANFQRSSKRPWNLFFVAELDRQQSEG